jgi:hypothetical protein
MTCIGLSTARDSDLWIMGTKLGCEFRKLRDGSKIGA